MCIVWRGHDDILSDSGQEDCNPLRWSETIEGMSFKCHQVQVLDGGTSHLELSADIALTGTSGVNTFLLFSMGGSSQLCKVEVEQEESRPEEVNLLSL